MKNSLLMNLYLDYQSHFKELQKSLKSKGFNLNESLLLLALFFEGSEGVTPGELAKCLHLKKDQVSHSLKNLEKARLVIKKLAPVDGRKSLIEITPLGKKQGADLIQIFDSAEINYENIEQ